MITIPIITRIYEEDGEIKFEVAGEKDVPLEMLENIIKNAFLKKCAFYIFTFKCISFSGLTII